jgi:hypothetical protein
MKKLMFFIFSLFLANTVFASFVINPSVSYMSRETEMTQPAAASGKQSETRIDVKLGYVLPMGLYLGGMYASTSEKNGTVTDKGSSIGPTIGYFSMMGFYTLFTYYIIGQMDSTPPNKFTGGKGPQVDVGWVFPISAYFSIGPQITWRSLEYNKFETAGVSLDSDYKATSIAPYLSLWFMF